MSFTFNAIGIQNWDTSLPNGTWINRGDTVVHDDKVVYQFDFRAVAQYVLNTFGVKDAWLEYVWGDRWTKESKNGGQVPIYCPDVAWGGVRTREDRVH